MAPTFSECRTPWTWTPGMLWNHDAARFRVTTNSKLIGWRMSVGVEYDISVVLRMQRDRRGLVILWKWWISLHGRRGLTVLRDELVPG